MKNTLDSQPSMMTMVACLMQFDSITKWIRNIIPSISPATPLPLAKRCALQIGKTKINIMQLLLSENPFGILFTFIEQAKRHASWKIFSTFTYTWYSQCVLDCFSYQQHKIDKSIKKKVSNAMLLAQNHINTLKPSIQKKFERKKKKKSHPNHVQVPWVLWR